VFCSFSGRKLAFEIFWTVPQGLQMLSVHLITMQLKNTDKPGL